MVKADNLLMVGGMNLKTQQQRMRDALVAEIKAIRDYTDIIKHAERWFSEHTKPSRMTISRNAIIERMKEIRQDEIDHKKILETLLRKDKLLSHNEVR